MTDDAAAVVERHVSTGLLVPLNDATYEAERAGLAEDVMNWNHGHPMVPVLVEPTQVRQHH